MLPTHEMKRQTLQTHIHYDKNMSNYNFHISLIP
jgi:hypothetical protein